MPSAVIFDRDGVLVGVDPLKAARLFPAALPLSLEEVSERWHAWGQRQGFPRNQQEEKNFMRGLWDAISDELDLSPMLRRELYAVDYTRILVAFPDALAALRVARDQGLKTAVLSNFAMASLDASLAAVGLAEFVDVAAAATVIGAAKPAAAAYLHVAQQLGVVPASCLFFDDSPEHVAGAARLGMRAYLVDRRRDDHDLAAHIVRDLTPLPRLLGT
jgi:putative hydrolase of the HAD superfamily